MRIAALEAVAAIEEKDTVDIGVDPIDEPGEMTVSQNMIQDLADSLGCLFQTITCLQEDCGREKRMQTALEEELVVDLLVQAADAREETCTVDIGVDPISEIQKCTVNKGVDPVSEIKGVPVNECDRAELAETEVKVQLLADSLNRLSEELARSQAEFVEQGQMMHAALENVVSTSEDSNGLLPEELTETTETIEQLASSLGNLFVGLTDFQQWAQDDYQRKAALDEALHVTTIDVETKQSAADTNKNADAVCKERGDHLILVLFWQFMKECFLMSQTSETVFIPEKVFRWLDRTNSGKIAKAEFQRVVVSLRVPLDSDTLDHIYDLVAYNVDGLTQEDFVRNFGNFILRDGLELLTLPKKDSVGPILNNLPPATETAPSQVTPTIPPKAKMKANAQGTAKASPNSERIPAKAVGKAPGKSTTKGSTVGRRA